MMKNFIGFYLLLVFKFVQAQVDWQLPDINLATVSSENTPLIYQDQEFHLYLTSGFCSRYEKHQTLPTLETVNENMIFYAQKMPSLVARFKNLVQELKPQFFSEVPDFFPLKIYLSIDGDSQCFNATSLGSRLDLPLQADEALRESVFKLIHHEIGHSLAFYNGEDQNIFDEAFADVISQLLNHEQGVLDFGASEERLRIEDWVTRSHSDPEGLARELGWTQSEVLYYARYWEMLYPCVSDDYHRDFSKFFSWKSVYQAGGESYITSCSLNSFLHRYGTYFGRRNTLIKLAKAYLNQPRIFHHVNLRSLLTTIFPQDSVIMVAPELFSQDFEIREKIVSGRWGRRHDRSRLHLSVEEQNSHKPWIGVQVTDSQRIPKASFSLMEQRMMDFYFTTREDCEKDLLQCLCPEKNGKINFQLDFFWHEDQKPLLTRKSFSLSVEKDQCATISVPDDSQVTSSMIQSQGNFTHHFRSKTGRIIRRI